MAACFSEPETSQIQLDKEEYADAVFLGGEIATVDSNYGIVSAMAIRDYRILAVGSDDEINLNYYKPEFLEWKWIEPEKVLDLVIPFKKNMYEKILLAFKKNYN